MSWAKNWGKQFCGEELKAAHFYPDLVYLWEHLFSDIQTLPLPLSFPVTHIQGICSGFMEFSQIHLPLVDLQNVNCIPRVCVCVRVHSQGEGCYKGVPWLQTFAENRAFPIIKSLRVSWRTCFGSKTSFLCLSLKIPCFCLMNLVTNPLPCVLEWESEKSRWYSPCWNIQSA